MSFTTSKIKSEIAKIISANNDAIEHWFFEKYQNTRPLFYSSVDVRHSGNKIVPVDTNLFPAGFNLLSESQAILATQQVIKYFTKYYPNQNKIALIIENHTRNKYYLQNVKAIYTILQNANLDVTIARVGLQQVEEVETIDGTLLKTHPIIRDKNKILVNNQAPEIILLNNDFSSGAPEILKNLQQPIFPPIDMGWHRRRKSSHFHAYDEIAHEFCRKFSLDVNYITALFTKCGEINFKEKQGLERLVTEVNELLGRIKIRNSIHNIQDEPYVFIKANSGTYGMGIMVVKSAKEILDINKKDRHSMNVIKEGVENSEVVIQEGIPTIDTFEDKPAEPMIYLVNGVPISCNYRINSNQDKFGNLNSKGMEFFKFEGEEKTSFESCKVQTLIARLASLAATQEVY